MLKNHIGKLKGVTLTVLKDNKLEANTKENLRINSHKGLLFSVEIFGARITFLKTVSLNQRLTMILA